jgi:hypothetical protein
VREGWLGTVEWDWVGGGDVDREDIGLIVGRVSMSRTVIDFGGEATLTPVPDETGIKPEKKGLVAAGWHGLLKSPMTTLWFSGWKVNCTVSPMLALKLLGLKASMLFGPTSTEIIAAEDPVTKAATAAMFLRTTIVWFGEVKTYA